MRRIPAFSRHRAGMTLVEVLAVCMIIAILASLTLPAVSRAIGRGRLTRCTNNMYQVAFALLRYDESNSEIPGWLNAPTPLRAYTWTVPLLPLLGRSDLSDALADYPNQPPPQTIDILVCPANRPAKNISYPPTHYAANVGSTQNLRGATENDGDDGVFLNLVTGSPGSLSQASGRSLESIAEADGTSTTLAFAEKAASWYLPNTWNFNMSGTAPVIFGTGTSNPPVFGVAGTAPPAGTPILNSGTDAFGNFAPSSPHADGVVVAYCDGHTGFLSDKLQPYEYGQLLTPKSRWRPVTSGTTNSAAMQSWLLNSGSPYLLDEKALRP